MGEWDDGGEKRVLYTQGEVENGNHDFEMNSKLLMEIACENYKS